jgi:hypothetical protein
MAGKLVAAVTLLVCLVGCSVVSPPTPTEQDRQQLYAEMLDRTWISTGLSERMSRPRPTSAPLVDSDTWEVAVIVCMADEGYHQILFHWEPERGYYLDEIPDFDASVRDDAELQFFVCVSRLPGRVLNDGDLQTKAELEYRYDDYRRRIVPCLLVNGLPVSNVETRDQFAATQGAWTPYQELSPELRTSPGFERLVARCDG